LASIDGACGHAGSSAVPPSASLYRERMTLVPTDHSGFPPTACSRPAASGAKRTSEQMSTSA